MKIKKSEPVKTVLTIVLGFMVVYMVTHGKWAMWTALITGVLGLSSTYISQKIDGLWMKLTYVLSLIMPNVLLSVVFFVFLLPVSLLQKLLGKKDAMMLKSGYKTTFVATDRSFEKGGFEKPW